MNKKTIIIAILVTALIFATGCEKKGKVDLTSPFVGGTAGVKAEFVDLRTEVFDGGRDPFDVTLKLENKGESPLPKNKITIKLTGINPAEFSKVEENLKINPEEDLIEVKKDANGNILPGPPVYAVFKDLNHITPVVGTTEYTLRAEYCYLYSTRAVSKICVRENLLTPEEGGLCEIVGDKQTFNSGGPLQVQNFKEQTRARDKISFSFEIKNAGTGKLYERNSNCNKIERQKQDRVFVKINTNIPGLSCSGLETTTDTRIAEGFVTLFDGTRLISCTQTISSPSDYEQVVAIELNYDYEEFVQTKIKVKHSE